MPSPLLSQAYARTPIDKVIRFISRLLSHFFDKNCWRCSSNNYSWAVEICEYSYISCTLKHENRRASQTPRRGWAMITKFRSQWWSSISLEPHVFAYPHWNIFEKWCQFLSILGVVSLVTAFSKCLYNSIGKFTPPRKGYPVSNISEIVCKLPQMICNEGCTNLKTDTSVSNDATSVFTYYYTPHFLTIIIN